VRFDACDEAFLDPISQCIGAVSTYSIYHPTDDIAALNYVLDFPLPAALKVAN
jgi:hypothetical protein